MGDAVLGFAVLLNSVSIIAVAVMLALMARRHRRLTDEITELQAVVDLILVEHGEPTVFAPRYDLDIERVADEGHR